MMLLNERMLLYHSTATDLNESSVTTTNAILPYLASRIHSSRRSIFYMHILWPRCRIVRRYSTSNMLTRIFAANAGREYLLQREAPVHWSCLRDEVETSYWVLLLMKPDESSKMARIFDIFAHWKQVLNNVLAPDTSYHRVVGCLTINYVVRMYRSVLSGIVTLKTKIVLKNKAKD